MDAYFRFRFGQNLNVIFSAGFVVGQKRKNQFWSVSTPDLSWRGPGKFLDLHQ